MDTPLLIGHDRKDAQSSHLVAEKPTRDAMRVKMLVIGHQPSEATGREDFGARPRRGQKAGGMQAYIRKEGSRYHCDLVVELRKEGTMR